MMRSLVLLFALVAFSMAAALQPGSAVVEKGVLCGSCREIFVAGENLGDQYNTAWLTAEVELMCKSLGGFSHSCRKWYMVEFNTIDQKIRAKENPQYACVDIQFCQ